MTDPIEPPASPTPTSAAPWWKRPLVWLLALGGAVVMGVLAVLRAKRPAPPPVPEPPPAPELPPVEIPKVDDKPADTYEAGKVEPAKPTDEGAVEDAIARLNARDKA